MKFFTRLILPVFILFQFSTIIICVVNARNESKITLNITEEEDCSKDVKEIKAVFVVDSYKLLPVFDEVPKKKVHDYYLLKKYMADATIFLLPPKQV
ncbi:hypothetical protein ACSN7Q_000850 [Flavobacterium psychrophilum]